MSEHHNLDAGTDVAVIAVAGRFPGAETVDEFWNRIVQGVDSIRWFSDEELRETGVSDTTLRDPAYVKARGTIEGADRFDAAFFGYSAREAELTDPQQRVFLECAWEALERAGYDPARTRGLVGVFAGAALGTYLRYVLGSRQAAAASALDLLIANDKDHLAPRVSYKLDLRGPSVTVQTACSTSLVAVHLAVQSLLARECDMALAGGVSIRFPQVDGYLHQYGSIASPDGRCRAFDARARGTVSGNGAAIAVLKRLDDAQADADTVLAVVRGTAINNDGARKAGYTAPSVQGQATAIEDAMAVADVDPATIGLVEAHGTGTELGDPIEIEALVRAFGRAGPPWCAIGSVKTNIGHLDTASGIAGFIKAVLAVERGVVPPSLYFEEPNPRVDFEHSPFRVATRTESWPLTNGPRRAGVSSFGLGGTNAHVVLEQAPPPVPATPDIERPAHLLLLSARTPEALDRAAGRLASHLGRESALALADVAHTLRVGRRSFAHRRIAVASDTESAVATLATRGDSPSPALTGLAAEHRPLALIFPGHGVRLAGPGVGLYRIEPAFRAALDGCARVVESELDIDVRPMRFAVEGHEAAAEGLDRLDVAHTTLFALEYALAQCLAAWGMRPCAMLGHSLGEYVAACLAGVFSLDDALRLVAARGRLMQTLPRGGMLAVNLDETGAQALVSDRVSIAAVNGPQLTVLAGDTEALDTLARELNAREIGASSLAMTRAFHSPVIDAILDRYADLVAGVALHPPQVPFLSNVTGTWITPEQATDPGYWAAHMRRPVRFVDAARALLEDTDRVALEAGPGHVLTNLVRAITPRTTVVPLLDRAPEEDEYAAFLEALGRLWIEGVPIDWEAFGAGERRWRVPLPTYPFERQRYWVDAAPRAAETSPPAPAASNDVADWYGLPVWRPTPFLRGDIRTKGCWLVFANELTLGDAVAGHMPPPVDAITIVPGEAFERIGDRSFAARPGVADDYCAVLAALHRAGLVPDVVLHMWEPSTSADADLTAGGFASLVALAQALETSRVTTPLRVLVVTRRAVAVLAGRDVVPERATVLGACLVIAQEYHNVSCRLVDIGDEPVAALLDRLVAEIGGAASEHVIAYRDGRRWTRGFQRARIERPDTPAIRPGGVYLITGGLGKVGRALGRHLAQELGARIAVCSRSASSRDGAAELGPDAFVIDADIGVEREARRVVQQIITRFGALHGVIHAAGVAGHDALVSLREITPARVAAQVRPKIAGTRALAAALDGLTHAPDFCLLISSAASILGGLGYAAYSAANAYLDAFAVAQRARSASGGTRWLSASLDSWGARGRLALDEGVLPPERGVEAIVRLIGAEEIDHVIVTTSDLDARLARWTGLDARSATASAAPPPPPAAAPRRTTAEYVAPRNDVEAAIARKWEGLLGVEPIGAFDDFFELGGHSLLATQLIAWGRATFEVELPLRAIFDASTVAAMAEAILARRPARARVPSP